MDTTKLGAHESLSKHHYSSSSYKTSSWRQPYHKTADNETASIRKLKSSNNDNLGQSSAENDSWHPNNKIASILFGIMSVWLFMIPDVTQTKRLATKWGGACGFAMASFLFRSMKDGTTTTPVILSSLYRRGLYSGLFLFCTLGIPSGFPGEGGFFAKAAPGILTSISMALVRMYGSIVAFQGWKASFDGDDDVSSKESNNIFQLIWSSLIRETTSQVRQVKDKKKSLFYRNSTLLMIAIAYSNFMEGMFQLRYRNDLQMLQKPSALAIPMRWSAGLQFSSASRLILIASVILSLKRASEDDEDDLLSKPIFVQFNAMIALWAWIVAIGKGIHIGGFALDTNVIQLVAFGGLFALKGVKGYRRQQGLGLVVELSSSADNIDNESSSTTNAEDESAQSNGDQEGEDGE